MKANILLLSILLTTSCATVFGGGLLTNLTQAELESALAGGGTVLFGTNGTLTLSHTITIRNDAALDANGYDVKISGAGTVRLFQVNTNVQFQLKGVTLADGLVVGADGTDNDPAPPGEDAYGAGILNQGGRLTLLSCTISNCVVQGGNGGTDQGNPQGNAGAGGRGMGAALCNLGGYLYLTNCTLSANRSAGGQGSASLQFFGQATGISGNGLGGAIYSEGGLVYLHQATFSSNRATGAVAASTRGNSKQAGDSLGGALFVSNSWVLIVSSLFVSNTASAGPAPSSMSYASKAGHALGGALFLSAGSSGSIGLSTFQGNSAVGGDGGRYNPAGTSRGGSIFNRGILEVSGTTFTSESSLAGGWCLVPATAQGGAICSENSLILNACALNGNRALGGSASAEGSGAPGAAGEGASVWVSGLMAATNCTLVSNRAIGGVGGSDASGASYPGGPARGGALCISNATAALVNLTVAANQVEGGSAYVKTDPPGPSEGGSLWSTNSTATLWNTILANSTGDGEMWGAVTDGGYNLCSDGTAHFSAPGSLNNADPLLGALSNNGGPTPTMPLLAGSPARDVVTSGFPPTDQRGTVRPQGPAADVGAFEAGFLSGPPTIVNQPQSANVRAGTNLTFGVVASGVGSLSYQWFKDSLSIQGATNTALPLAGVEAADAGAYWVAVSNDSGTTTSQHALLTVDSTPLILSPPASVVVSPGATVSFTVVADGPNLGYQWWHEGAALTGATSSTYTISSALADAKGNYYVVITNFAGATTSAEATLAFDASALSILVQPKDVTVEAGKAATFSVLVTGVPPFSYQWQHDGIPISGATGSSLSIPAATEADSGSYTVAVDNGYRQETSDVAHLTVTPGAARPNLIVARMGSNLTITFQAEARSYRLFSSTDLLNWTSVATNSVVAPGPSQFVQPITAAAQRSFRVMTP